MRVRDAIGCPAMGIIMKIGIRVDGGSKVGFGHLVRMEALAGQFAALNHEVYFFSQVFSPRRISSYRVIDRPEGFNMEEELKWLREQLIAFQCQMLIVDSYAYQEQELDQISRWPVYSVYYDDLNRHLFSVDCVANGSFFGEKLPYKGNALFLLGKDYTLLRPEFAGLPEKKINDNVKEVLITVGGADPGNTLPKLATWTKEFEHFSSLRFHLVIGPAFLNKDVIANETKDFTNFVLHYDADMAELIKRCDMAVSAAGQTVHELMAGGLPALLIIVAENQRQNADMAAKLGCGINLGNIEAIEKEAFLSALEELYFNRNLRQSMSRKGQSLIDGNGAKRLAERLVAESGSLKSEVGSRK